MSETSRESADVRAGRAARAVVPAAAAAVWLLLCWPLLTGERALFFRDLFHHFAPLEAFGAMQLRAGEAEPPALNPTWALGQPYRGDPVASAFYPTNLLFLALPFWTAFNLHLLLHWLLATVAMGRLARALGGSPEAAALAALAYGGGGWLLSSLSLFHILAVAAWWPLVLLGGVRGGRRGIAMGGLACGLALLAGEPLTAALGIVPLLLLAVERHGWRRGLLTAAAIGGAGLLVAAPQWVETLRVLATTFRGSHGVLASQAGFYRFHPARLLELVVPLPFGTPAAYAGGEWVRRIVPHVPFFYALYAGVVAAALALAGARRRPALALLAIAAVLVAWAPGVPARLFVELSGGVFRSPEKALFWLALALPLLAAAGLDAALASGGRRSLAVWLAGGALLLAAAAAARLALGAPGVRLAEQLALAGLVVAVAGWALWRRLPAAVLGLQLLTLLPLQALLLTVETPALARPSPLASRLGARRAVLPVEYTYPPWSVGAPDRTSQPPALRARRLAFALGPVPGVLEGLTYPMAPDLVGMHHRFFDYVLFRTAEGGWEERVAWMRTLGVEAVTSPRPLTVAGLAPLAVGRMAGEATHLYAVEDPAPAAWWPHEVVVAATPAEAYARVARRAAPTITAVVPLALPAPHRAGARVAVLASDPDRVVLAVRGQGGLLVVRRAFQPLWRARVAGDGEELPVLPADVALTGVLVPAGAHRVELYVPQWPMRAAALVGLLSAALLALAAGARRPRAASRGVNGASTAA